MIAAQLPAIAQTNLGIIEGSVVRKDTAEPLSNVLVRATSEKKGTPQTLQAFTDESGRFSIVNVPPGTYDIQANRRGHFAFSESRAKLVVRKGDPAHPLALALVAVSTIHGKVLQPDGRGMAGVTVGLAKAWYGNVQPSIIATGEPTTTDANGEYRFEVASGEYFVRTPATTAAQSWHTYFPGTVDPGKAERLRVTQGADVTADIHLSEIPLFTISVRIVYLVPDRGTRHAAAFYLTDRNSTVQEVEFVPAGCTCPPSGPFPPKTPFSAVGADRFEIRGVRPGSYELRATTWIGDNDPFGFRLIKPGETFPVIPIYDGRTTVEVTNGDADATVEIRPAAPLHREDVKGRVTSNGKSVPKDTALVSLYSTEGISSEYLADLVDGSGRFTISGVPAGRYQFSISARSPDAYVEDVRQGGVSILDSGLAVGKAPSAPLEVFVNPAGGVIDGSIENGRTAVIALISTTGWNKGKSIKVVHANPSGDFKIRGIPPGEYRILAFNDPNLDGADGGAIYSPYFTGRYTSQSIPLTVRPGVPTTLRISAIVP